MCVKHFFKKYAKKVKKGEKVGVLWIFSGYFAGFITDRSEIINKVMNKCVGRF